MPFSAMLPKCSEEVTLGLHLKLLPQAALLIASLNTMTVNSCNEQTSSFPLHAEDFDGVN